MSGSSPPIAAGARYLRLPDVPLLSPAGGAYVPSSFPSSKDPSELLDYVIDWTAPIEEASTITSILSCVVSPANAVQIASMTIVRDTLVLLLVSGGVDQVDASFTMSVQTSLGRIVTRKVTLPIRAVDPSTANLPTYVTDPVTGAQITDPVTGLPIEDPFGFAPTAGVIDPATDQPITDPITNLPIGAPA